MRTDNREVPEPARSVVSGRESAVRCLGRSRVASGRRMSGYGARVMCCEYLLAGRLRGSASVGGGDALLGGAPAVNIPGRSRRVEEACRGEHSWFAR